MIEKRAELYDRKWNGKAIHAFTDTPLSRGVSGFFFKNKECNIDILNVHKSNDGRKLLVNAKIDETLLTIVNLYATNKESERITFFNSLHTFFSSHTPQDSKLIIGGDFNCNLNKENDKSCKKLSKLTNKLDLVDVWLKKNPTKNGYTWCDAENSPKSRIDYIFVRNDTIDYVKKYCCSKITRYS